MYSRVKHVYLWLYIFLLETLITFVSSEVSYVVPNSIAEGRRRYEELVSKTPRYGPCWRQAIEDLEVGCKHLTDDVQGRLALEFTNCLLQQIGQPGYCCPKTEPLSACEALKTLQKENFPTFSTFFTHTQVICSFLQGQVWQERTEMTIASLSETSVKVSEGMTKAGRVQEDLLRLQQKSIDAQKDMIQQLKSEFVQVANWANQHHKLLAEAFEQVTKLHDFVVNLFSTVYAFGYYIAATAASYVMSATKRTSGARYWLFLLFTVNLAVERMLANVYADKEIGMLVILAKDGPIQSKVSLCRRIFCGVAIVLVLWFGTTYKDYMEVNHRILLTLQRDLEAYIKNSDSKYMSEEDKSFMCPHTSEPSSEASCSGESCMTESRSLTPLPDATVQPVDLKVQDIVPECTGGTSPGGYNLRPRLSRGTPNQITEESVTEFVKTVTKELKRRPQRRRRSNLGVLSSDED